MVSKQESVAAFETLMIAGSERTTTLMDGVDYQLLQDPEVLYKT